MVPLEMVPLEMVPLDPGGWKVRVIGPGSGSDYSGLVPDLTSSSSNRTGSYDRANCANSKEQYLKQVHASVEAWVSTACRNTMAKNASTRHDIASSCTKVERWIACPLLTQVVLLFTGCTWPPPWYRNGSVQPRLTWLNFQGFGYCHSRHLFLGISHSVRYLMSGGKYVAI
jgi:hypothetical protein